MKRIIFIAVFFAANIFNASAYDFSAISPSGHVLYYNINGGDVTVSGGESLAGAVIIPDSVTYNGIIRAVTSIGDIAFRYCSGMTSVTIPGGVSSIGNGAFLGSGLVSVTIPDGVSIIGDNSFKFCYSLTTVSIGSGVISIGSCAFYECISLTSVIIPDNVTSIGEGAFGACDSLSYVSLGNGIISIGINAFHYCPNLTSITIPNNVATIGDGAFYNDSSLMEIRSLASVPPTLGSHVFYKRVYFGQYQAAYGEYLIDIPINVPCGSLAAYQATNGWSEFSSISEEQITINVDGGNYGSVSVNRPTCYTASITANANYGYHFTVWDDGDTNNPRIIALTQDTSFTAFFEKNNYYIVGVPDNMEKGNVIGSDTVEYLDTVVLTATSNYGYHFSRWSDNNTSNPRQIIATQNGTITAIFDYNQYTITLNVDSNILGSTYGGGSYNYLSEQTITATASYGYHFMAWNDGDTNNPRTITLTQDTIFTALFAKNIYTITAISVDTIKGSVIGSTSIEYLDSVTIIANSNYGYHFTAWNDGNADNPRIIVATRDSLFTATFDHNQYTITLNVDTNIHGSVVGDGSYNYLSEQTITATAAYGYHFTAWSDGDTNNPRTITLTQDTIFTAQFAKNTYTITAISADTIRGSVIGSTSIEYLDSVTIMANPNYGYHFTAWNDGNTDNPRIIVATRDSVFTASFVYNQYTITLNVDSDIHGSVVGDGSYNYLSEQTITATANYGYHFTAWSDGDTNNPRTITLTQDTGFTALFAKNQYTLTLQSDDVAHGSVIGSGVFDYLDTVTIEATAVEHYHFVHWSDGNTDNPRQYVLIGNDTLIAIFAIDTHHVSVESCNIAFGSVEGSGDFEYGTPATVTATAYSGYQFVRWSNGDTHNPYTFAVLQDTTLVAIFEAETQGIDDVIADAVNVYTLGGQIVIETNLKDEISIYDIVGRKVDGGHKTRFDVPTSGVYLIKIGTSPTKKVVVVK